MENGAKAPFFYTSLFVKFFVTRCLKSIARDSRFSQRFNSSRLSRLLKQFRRIFSILFYGSGNGAPIGKIFAKAVHFSRERGSCRVQFLV